jgi:hypothetical protein
MGAELFFQIVDPSFISTWLIAKENLIAYVGCESFKFSTVFLPVKFCAKKNVTVLINSLSCVNMNTTV